jgi:hypothetical protein
LKYHDLPSRLIIKAKARLCNAPAVCGRKHSRRELGLGFCKGLNETRVFYASMAKRVLVSNDDGITADGLLAITREVRASCRADGHTFNLLPGS